MIVVVSKFYGTSKLLRTTLSAVSIIAALLFASLSFAAERVPTRIVSMSPAGTEILFALGLDDRLLGVTRYCDYPPEAAQLPQLSSMTEVNLETLLRLDTELVVMEDINSGLGGQIEKLGIPVLVLHHNSLAELRASIEAVGKVCGASERAEALSRAIGEDIERIKKATAPLKRPKVLVAVDRDIADASIRSLYVAGSRSFYNELVEIAGGTNVLEESLPYARLSSEGLLSLQPDVIIDIVGDHGFAKGVTREQVERQWQTVPELNALSSGRIHVLMENAALRPGPRIARLTEIFASFIHPELSADLKGGAFNAP